MKHYIYLYLVIINIVGFLSMYIDKRKAKKHEFRISENTLMLIALIGGSVGSLIGMNIFRHKTKHIKFSIGIPLILLLQLVFIMYFELKEIYWFHL
ncbi:MAG: DUF1294 domain-containing protein [Clostridium sp.]|uniref:DUF1294 domain-containing protein n=1 Tax=Clostridium TaxID=1485 RepID=UPI002152E673|nr:DUF1294 domain-containing protein [Clostridium sp. LY3-2]MCR6513807.1 DUF1294 domain-containing protein [Clostridium sp. LY3-2]